MKDAACVAFLQWALPRLHLRWPGFRKVRRQVCKRVARRLDDLGLPDVSAYPSYLETHPDEWPVLDELCWISISRFYRDRGVHTFLERAVLPELAQLAGASGERALRCWSAGCASGEEPYTLAILWRLALAPRFPDVTVQVLATDVDQRALDRAERGWYPASSLKELPASWLDQAFVRVAGGFSLRDELRKAVTFVRQDLRKEAPEGPFHLILCRNLAFTYFDLEVQRAVLDRILSRLAPGGALVIGSLESLPEVGEALEPWSARCGVFRKSR
ncbi:MAG: protein-glutamate O-methyltransferase CheR [Nitrospirota bacterium]